jgi:MFS transporter, DHA2 family, multidrug resistance protein
MSAAGDDGGRQPGQLSRSAAGNHNPWLITAVVSIATFMLVLDTSIANVALRDIAGSLAASVDESTWIITTYLVANAVIVPVSGWLSNVLGRKRYYMICVAVFTGSSLLCGLATSLPMLIVFRILQGLGGGGMAPSEQAILADTFPPEKRAQAFALYGVAVIVAPTVGPTLGGWITDNFSWHWIFFINVPVGIASLLLVHWLLVEPDVLVRERRERLRGGLKIDYIGFALVALWLGSFEVVLDEGQRSDWFQSDFIVAFTAISILAAAIFFPWELTRRDPIVEVRILLQRQFATTFLMMLAVGGVLFGTTQILPQLMQTSYGYTAMPSGLALMPGGFAMLIMMPLAGQIASKVQPKYLIATGMAIVTVAMWHMTSLVPNASFGFFAWARIYQMIGLPFLFIPITAASYSELRPDQTNQGSALINVARNVGGSIGVSLANTVLLQRTQVHQARLTANIYPSSIPYQQTIHHLAGALTARGAAPAGVQHQAIGIIGSLIGNQASILAYIDVFRDYAAFSAVMVLLAFLIRHVNTGAGHGAGPLSAASPEA